MSLDNIKSLEEQRQDIVSSWENSGLLDGLKGMRKDNIATLLENQANAMLSEVQETCEPSRFDNIALPIVQRVVARTMAQDLVAVQPMDPVGTVTRSYNKKPRLPRKIKKELKKAFGDGVFVKWVHTHDYDRPWHGCVKHKTKKKFNEGGLLHYLDIKYDG